MLPRVTKKEQSIVASLQLSVARKKFGSENHKKAQLKLAKRRAKLAARRKDAAHKATTKIVKENSFIVIEDLKMRNMTKSAKGTIENPGRNVRQKAGLNRSLLDVAPYQIRQMLEYKCEWYGAELVIVNPRNTSRRCYNCGLIHKDNRKSQAEFKCIHCKYFENADLNAAKNILDLGL